MSRFDLDPEEIAKESRALHERTTKDRASYEGGAPPVNETVTPPKKSPAKKAPATEAMTFPFRMTCTFTEDDPVGRILAERLRAMPEGSRKHYSASKAVREAIMQDLEGLAKRL